MNWTPLGDKVIVEPDEAPDKVGSILLPDQAKQTPQTGRVLAVGPGTEDHPMTVDEGTRVLFQKWGGTDFEIEKGRTVKVLAVGDLLAVQK